MATDIDSGYDVWQWLSPELYGYESMSRIPEIYAKSIVYIYPSVEDARNNKRNGATGFAFVVPFSTGQNLFHPYIVTNAHYFDAYDRAAIRVNTKYGSMEIVDTVESDWHKHPNDDDLAVFSYTGGDALFLHDMVGFPDQWLVTEQFVEDYSVGMGDEIYMMGRFQDHEGTRQNRPVACFGNIAQMPDKNDPVEVTRTVKGEKKKFTQESFLIELRSISGYSGSPVFLDLSQGTHFDPHFNEKRKKAFPYKLLGIIAGHFYAHDYLTNDERIRQPGIRVESNSAMAYAVPAWKLRKLLDIEELRNERAKAESKHPRAHERESDATP